MTPSIPGDGHSPNRKLYRDGRRYLRDLPPWEQVKYETAELKPIAQKCATSVQEVNAALGFVAAVDQIADVAGATAKKLLLSGENVLLTPALVRKIAQRSQSSVQAAMRQAANGLHPLAPLIPVGKPPELALWDYDFDRLGFALNLLQGSNSARLTRSLTADEKETVYRDATSARVAAAAMLVALEPFAPAKIPPARSTGTTNELTETPRKDVRKARLLVEAITRDLPLGLTRRSPSPGVVRELKSATKRVQALATRIAKLTQPLTAGRPNCAAALVSDQPQGPDERLGTYVMILQSEQPVVLRIGRLGTFWLPAGYLLYVGSALAKELVQQRTSRHRNADAVLRWNLDYLKTFACPIERWWTHYGDEVDHEYAKKVECAWAMAMARLSGYCCPAPRCGANDCKKCPAHLYHTSWRPSCEAFAEVVCQALPDFGPIYRQTFD